MNMRTYVYGLTLGVVMLPGAAAAFGDRPATAADVARFEAVLPLFAAYPEMGEAVTQLKDLQARHACQTETSEAGPNRNVHMYCAVAKNRTLGVYLHTYGTLPSTEKPLEKDKGVSQGDRYVVLVFPQTPVEDTTAQVTLAFGLFSGSDE